MAGGCSFHSLSWLFFLVEILVWSLSCLLGSCHGFPFDSEAWTSSQPLPLDVCQEFLRAEFREAGLRDCIIVAPEILFSWVLEEDMEHVLFGLEVQHSLLNDTLENPFQNTSGLPGRPNQVQVQHTLNWIAMGVSASGSMIGADMTVMQRNEYDDAGFVPHEPITSSAIFSDMWSEGFARPVEDHGTDFEILSYGQEQNNELTSMWFLLRRRLLVSCTSMVEGSREDLDIDPDLPTWFIFAFSLGNYKQARHFSYHGRDHRYSLNLALNGDPWQRWTYDPRHEHTALQFSPGYIVPPGGSFVCEVLSSHLSLEI